MCTENSDLSVLRMMLNEMIGEYKQSYTCTG